MLILCSAPIRITRAKSGELVAAFRHKHDPTGYSTELCRERRCMNCPPVRKNRRPLLHPSVSFGAMGFDALKLAEVRQLTKRLESVRDDTIILSVEEEPPVEKILKEFAGIKLVQYPFPFLTGAKFVAAVTHRAQEIGVSQSIAQEIARRTDGDMWFAEQELEKASANPSMQLISSIDVSGTVFDAADAYLLGRSGWRERVASFPDESMVSILATQSRTFTRVRDGETAGVHPYVARKFSTIKISDALARQRFLGALRALYAARQCATDEESQTLL